MRSLPFCVPGLRLHSAGSLFVLGASSIRPPRPWLPRLPANVRLAGQLPSRPSPWGSPCQWGGAVGVRAALRFARSPAVLATNGHAAMRRGPLDFAPPDSEWALAIRVSRVAAGTVTVAWAGLSSPRDQ